MSRHPQHKNSRKSGFTDPSESSRGNKKHRKRIPVLIPASSERGLVWQLSKVDRGGPWDWTRLEAEEEEYVGVMKRLTEFETKNWNELKRANCHLWNDLTQLPKSARDRLQKIKGADIEEMVSFRITGRKRVWCYKIGNLMQLLWWDPDHSVYPVEADRQDRAKRQKRR